MTHVENEKNMNLQGAILDQVRNALPTILPEGAELSFFGSRARGDATKDSDWDFLLVLNKPKVEENDYIQCVYPLYDMGSAFGEYFSIKVNTAGEWERRRGTPFYHIVEHDKIVL